MACSIGKRIVLRRKQVGLRQKDLAKRVGVVQVHISKWERSLVKPCGAHLSRLAAALKCSSDWLLTGKDGFATALSPDGVLMARKKMAPNSDLLNTGLIAAFQRLFENIETATSDSDHSKLIHQRILWALPDLVGAMNSWAIFRKLLRLLPAFSKSNSKKLLDFALTLGSQNGLAPKKTKKSAKPKRLPPEI